MMLEIAVLSTQTILYVLNIISIRYLVLDIISILRR